MCSSDLELFRNKNGTGPNCERQTSGPSDPDNFLAMIKDQSEGHHTKIVDEEAPGKDPSKYLISCRIDGDMLCLG